MSTTSTSPGSSLSGIFAKFVARFLVRWVKRTLGIGQASPRPALSSTPSPVAGRTERDREHEFLGAHTGHTGPRADETPAAAQALQGDDYGAHAGGSGPRPDESPQAAQAIQGDDYGAHRGVGGSPCHIAPAGPRQYRAVDPEMRRAAIWDVDARLEAGNLLRNADSSTLRSYGLNDHQVEQCGRGRVPSGHLLDRVFGPDNQASWQLVPGTPENQLLANSFHNQLVDIRLGDTRILSVPFGDQSVVLVLGPASPPVATMAGA